MPLFTLMLPPIHPPLRACPRGSYRVQYAQRAFAQEVQTVRVSCGASPEIQVVSTDAQDIDEVQLVHAVLEDGKPRTSIECPVLVSLSAESS